MNASQFIKQLDNNFPGIVEAGFIHEQEYLNLIHRSDLDTDLFESIVMRVFFITMDPDKKIKSFINQYDNGLFLYLVELSADNWLFVMSDNEAFAKMHFFIKYITSDGQLDMSVLEQEQDTSAAEGIQAAKRIQSLLFKNPTSFFNNFEKADLWYKPTHELGGDFYWGNISKNYAWVVVGDCTGHGTEGALATVSVLSILEQIFDDELKPHHIIKRLHNSLENIQKQKLDEGYGIGNEMMVIKYDLKTNELLYSATGISLYHKSEKIVRYKTKKALYDPDRVIKFIRSRKLKVEKGDEILVHSDGIPDQLNFNQKTLKTTQVLKSLEDANSLSLDVLKSLVADWSVNEPQTDDIVGFHLKR